MTEKELQEKLKNIKSKNPDYQFTVTLFDLTPKQALRLYKQAKNNKKMIKIITKIDQRHSKSLYWGPKDFVGEYWNEESEDD